MPTMQNDQTFPTDQEDNKTMDYVNQYDLTKEEMSKILAEVQAEKHATYNQDIAKGNVKFDSEKVRLELLPARALFDVAKVMTHGARKYTDDNWRQTEGSSMKRYIGSLKRHLNAIERGQDYDPDTGLLHSAHAACNMLFILEAQLQGYWNDDRMKDSDYDAYAGREVHL